MLFWVLIAAIVALLAAIRLAPTDTARWHVPITADGNKTFAGGAIRMTQGDADTFARLIDIATATPRTTQIAGVAQDGLVTFVTRSKWIGFPDYTTVQLNEGQIAMHARLRFGRSDLGVNTARLESWISELNR